VCFTVSDVGVDLPPIVEGRGVDALVGEGSVCGLFVCVTGCFSDRTQQLRQLYRTIQASRKLQAATSAASTS